MIKEKREGMSLWFDLHDDVVEFVRPYNIFCIKRKQRHKLKQKKKKRGKKLLKGLNGE